MQKQHWRKKGTNFRNMSIVSPDKRRGSSQYWQDKFNQAMGIIDELHEKSIVLKEIPGFLPVQKVKPKLSKKNTRITQVHGSMKAKNVLTVLKDIESKKQEQVKSKEATAKKKEDTKLAFLKCKEKCICEKQKCEAFGLKQCPVCQDILKSACSKAKCKVDGIKPVMIVPAAATASSSKRKAPASEAEESESDFSDSDFDDTENESDFESETSNTDDVSAADILRATWKTLSPPVTEDSLLGKWYGVVYCTKRISKLFVGKILKRFLADENGLVEKLEVRCLKPKVSSGTIPEDTPAHLPDVSLFDLADVIYGPLKVVPLKSDKFNVPDYEKAVEHFNNVKSMDRNSIF